jgi:catechol 2,3-dioxygenase-like lactoylglutathione lyase family enzyme
LLLHVRGMAEAERFYCGVLGCSVRSRMPQWGMLELSAGVTLGDTSDPNGAWALEGAAPGRNVDHFAIATTSWGRHRDARLAGDAQRRHRGRALRRGFAVVRDPSGSLVELIRKADPPPAT